MRTLPTVAIALLLVVAGCGSPGGSGTQTGTATDAPTATETTATATAAGNDSAASAPGVANGELTDAGALATAHRRALVNAGFETRLTVNATERIPTSGNGTSVVETSTLQQVVSERGARPYRYRLRTRQLGSRFDAWANDSLQVTRAMRGESVVRYQFGDPQSPASVTGSSLLRSYLSLGTYTVVDRTTREGTAFVTLRADELATEETDGLFVSGSKNVSNYSSTVVVDGEGRIHSLDVRANYTIDGQAGSVDVSYRLVRLGDVRVERPDWVTAALERRGEGTNASG